MYVDYMKEYYWVRETFFPEWDPEKAWKIEPAEDLGEDSDGFCDWDSKTIRILRNANTPVSLLLIHEICHAIRPLEYNAHYKPWIEEMAKAEQRALQLGMYDLAALISLDYEAYTEVPEFTPEEIYGYIFVHACNAADRTFDELVELMRDEYGAFSREEFFKRYPEAECRAAYDEGILEKKRSAMLRRIFDEYAGR